MMMKKIQEPILGIRKQKFVYLMLPKIEICIKISLVREIRDIKSIQTK